MIGLPAAPIVVLGATSRIAMDFVATAAPVGVHFRLHARRPAAVAGFLADHALPTTWNAGDLDAVPVIEGPIGGIINCVGVGDPAKARDMGAGIFDATARSDASALALLDRHRDAPYIFLSSGAVYGTGFAEPAGADTPACVPVNCLGPTAFYTVAKLHAEAVHRSMPARRIIDLRIFNYISRALNPNARFLVTDVIRAVRDGTVFETVDEPMMRDFIGPVDLRNLLLACLAAPSGFNGPVDAYSRAPIGKAALLALMAARFGLRYRWIERSVAIDATGSKPNYFSTFRVAEQLGFTPRFSSTEAVAAEAAAMLSGATRLPSDPDHLAALAA